MKRRYLRTYTCLVILCCSEIVAFAQTKAPSKALSPTEEALMAAEQAFVGAAKKGDGAFFKHTLADDFSYVGVDGQAGERQDRIDDFAEASTDLQPYNMKVLMIDERAGIVTYDAVVRIPKAEDQGPPPRYQHFSTVWVKQGDEWKMRFQQMTAAHFGDW